MICNHARDLLELMVQNAATDARLEIPKAIAEIWFLACKHNSTHVAGLQYHITEEIKAVWPAAEVRFDRRNQVIEIVDSTIRMVLSKTA